MDTLSIVKRIEARLAELGIAKTDFFNATGISSSRMSTWRSGKATPRPQALEKVAEYLGVTYDWLVTGLNCSYL